MATKPLATSVVFVDTSVFERANLNVRSGKFASLEAACAATDLHLLTTDITRSELRVRIEEKLTKARTALSSATREARFLSSLLPSTSPLLEEPDWSDLTEKATGALDAFFERCGAETLDATGADSRPVFEKYFAKKAPFGRAKKCHEFPDAFVLEALEVWSREHGEDVYIVSSDGDLEDACEGSATLHYVEDLPPLLEALVGDDKSISIAHAVVERCRPEIAERVGDSLSDLFAYLNDENGEVNSVQATEVRITDESVAHLEDDVATFYATAFIQYSADVTYDDPSATVYDREDQRTYCFRRIDATLERERHFDVEFKLRFSTLDVEDYDVEEVQFDGVDSLDVDVNEWG